MPGNDLQVIDLQPLVDIHSMLCDAASPLYIWSFGPPQIIACIVDHDLISSATHCEHNTFTQGMLEHLLARVCSGSHGVPGCLKVKTTCLQAHVRPSVFALQCLAAENQLASPSDARLPDLCHVFGLRHDALLSMVNSMISRHVSSLSYISYNGESYYLVRYFDNFESATASHLMHLCVAHGLQGLAAMSSRTKHAVLMAHMLGAGCIHNITPPLLTMPTSCLEVVAELI